MQKLRCGLTRLKCNEVDKRLCCALNVYCCIKNEFRNGTYMELNLPSNLRHYITVLRNSRQYVIVRNLLSKLRHSFYVIALSR